MHRETARKSDGRATFHIRPYPRARLYAVVHVWAKRGPMVAHLRRVLTRVPRGAQACCLATAPKNPTFAVVHFHRDHIDSAVIAHELLHATFCWSRRVGFAHGSLDDHRNPGEETLTRVLQHLCEQFINGAIRRNLL